MIKTDILAKFPLQTLDDSHFSAFSMSVPFLINRIDHFFNCTEERSSEQPSADVRLMQKFRTLWAFQRERLLAEPVARMSIFLNPNACHQLQGPFNVEQWASRLTFFMPTPHSVLIFISFVHSRGSPRHIVSD
jgi:hypothetical protein